MKLGLFGINVNACAAARHRRHRRALTQLSGREPERIAEAVEVTAHAPGVLRAQGKLEQANAKLKRIDKRIKWLAELKAATLTNDYAVALTRTPAEVSDDLFDQLRAHFDEEQLVELTHAVALGNYRGRFNVGLGIEAAGFSEGMVCAIPEPAPTAAAAP